MGIMMITLNLLMSDGYVRRIIRNGTKNTGRRKMQHDVAQAVRSKVA
jgi:hypothetical protein